MADNSKTNSKNLSTERLCEKIYDASDKAIDWNNRAASENHKVKLDRHDNYQSFLRIKLLTKKILATLHRPPCVGVFGPSQAGKSYLVSTLAKGKQGNLTVKLGNEDVDFLQRINPSGGRESTGVVTRFSIKKSENLDSEYPVEIRLLTESDILKILTNSFFSDFDHAGSMDLNPFTDEEIRTRLEGLQKKVDYKKRLVTLFPEDVLDIKMYLEASFANFVSNLKADFWPVAIDIAPFLEIEDRAELFSIIWRDFDLFTDLYKLFAKEINNLEGAEVCLAPFDSVVSDPGQISIVDAQLLSQLNSKNSSSVDIKPISIEGSAKSLPIKRIAKPILAALTAELRLTISDARWEFLNDLDILDFPGARSRKSLTVKDLKEIKENEDIKASQASELLLRGKVAYLFQRYTADQEMSAVLLCVPGGPQEVGYAPLINQWVCDANGDSSEVRSSVPPGLLFVLTKFDEELKTKGGDNEVNERARWTNRVESSLLEKFKNYEWVKKWDNKPFRNLYWLRNPEIKSSSFMQYEDDIEVSINPNDSHRIARLRQYFSEDENVKEHFEDPLEAWDSAMTPRDGGISNIVSGINRISDPAFRAQNLIDKTSKIRDSLASKLNPYFNEGGEKEVAIKSEQLNILKKSLVPLIKKNEVWRLFDILNISLDELKTLYYMVNTSSDINKGLHPLVHAGSGVEGDPTDLDDLLNTSISSWSNSSAESGLNPVLNIHSRAEIYSKKVVDTWATYLRDMTHDSFTASSLYMSEEAFSIFIEEMINASQRMRLQEVLALKLSPAENNAGATWEKIVDRQITIARIVISDFVNQLGFSSMELANRPKINIADSARIIFEPFPRFSVGTPPLTERPIPILSLVTRDWISALEKVVIQNAGFVSKDSLSPMLNKDLGEIIRLITVD